jgi:outer membrane immunogenic protein
MLAASAPDLMAADLALVPAPVPVVINNWSGLYLGAHIGVAWPVSSPNWSFADENLVFDPQSIPVGPTFGAVGGVHGGYNWQFAPAWIVGVEGDVSWSSLGQQPSSVPFTIGGVPLPNSSISMSANLNWLSTVRGRFGYLVLNDLMLFVTGGGAWANTEYTARTSMVPLVNPVTSSTSFTRNSSGWVLGGGVEWMAGPNFLVRAEYLYYGFNNNNVTASTFLCEAGGACSFLPLAVDHTWTAYSVQVGRVGASYKF